mmetsp:Transcript_6090/g.12195  ORF Transcript_6090/g.12195 Transcript_6090/m.12195 type:complete len:139 (+) Transcript_6090:1482-1898(+)
MSIPATKGFEIGSGFSGCRMLGSEHNDLFVLTNVTTDTGESKTVVRTVTNNSGGVQGGISNGEDIIIRAAFKPTSTIRKAQATVTRDLKPTTLEGKGRHDPCVVPRAVPIVEAMAALVIADHFLQHQALASLSRSNTQ